MQVASSGRVVITGVGVISPLGNNVDQLVASLRAGKSGIRPLTQLPHDAEMTNHGAQAWDFTGEVDDYGPLDKALQRTIRKSSKVMCREIEMGVAAAQWALHDAGFDAGVFDRDRTGVLFGCDYIMSLPQEFAAGIAACTTDGRFDFGHWGEKGLAEITPLWLLKYLPNMPASHVAIFNDLRGPNNSITVREASPCAAIAEAVSTLARGHADALLVGSTGSRVHLLRTMQVSRQEILAADRDDPTTMSRPFDVTRDGSVIGEGAGAMMLETLEHAEARGANILGEVVGYGSSAAGPAAGDEPLRVSLANVMRAAMRPLPGYDAVSTDRVGHINAHGVSDVRSDRAEAAAIVDVFGDVSRQPPVTTLKGHIGNLGAGGGMVEVIASLKSLDEELFAIRNLNQLDPGCPINAVTTSGVPAGDSFLSVNTSPYGQSSAVRITAFRP